MTTEIPAMVLLAVPRRGLVIVTAGMITKATATTAAAGEAPAVPLLGNSSSSSRPQDMASKLLTEAMAAMVATVATALRQAWLLPEHRKPAPVLMRPLALPALTR